MTLSIISINLNNSVGLRKTICSVLEQTYDDFEYIIVDGASTDCSQNVIEKYSNSFQTSFSWISEPDTGVYHAMNKGIKMAKGEYLLFLNSGDFLVNKLVLSDVFEINPTVDIICGRCNISQNDVVIHTTLSPSKITFGFLYESGLAHQSTFIKRDLFERFGYYREDFKYNSDIEFWYRTIILSNSSTLSISTIVSDYNTAGISSLESGTERYKAEMDEIFSNPLFQLIIPDYNQWIAERKEMQILYWVKSKRIVYQCLVMFYGFAVWFVKKKKVVQ